MCGIIGYTGHRPAIPVVMEALSRLEYRGYDSAGVAWQERGAIHTVRSVGKLECLEKRLATLPPITATCGLGHTRWATHGAPAECNAHPHMANDHEIVIVHNGIIENYREIKEKLQKANYKFYSETDTEALVNLVSEYSREEPDLLHAFARALKEAFGAYAVCMISAKEPGVIYAARLSAPLIFGKGVGENFIASDIPAFLPWTRDVVFLEDGQIVRITSSSYEIFDLDALAPVHLPVQAVQWNMQAAQKEGFKHFMLKEIFEQPRVIRDGIAGRIVGGKVSMEEMDNSPLPNRLHIVGCGTSYHSGLWARYVIEPWADIPCDIEIASEFRYRDMAHSSGEIAIFISQSGETADTLAALRKAKTLGVSTIGICNVVGSSIAREADVVIYTHAGPEISVASTKAMISQMLALTLLAMFWGQKKGCLAEKDISANLKRLAELPAILDDNLPEFHERARQLAKKYAQARSFFYIGRGICWPLALEGALKLKELSYIHAEGYAGGELKHGPIALIDASTPTFALALDDELFPKIKSNIEEIEARSGQIIALTNCEEELKADDIWHIPSESNPFSSFLVLPALQLFSYEMAEYLGKDVDQPRNLAKSVTVE